MNDFKDKTAIVSGGAAGIGEELCLAMAARKAIIVVADIDSEGAEETAATIRKNGGRAEAIRVDVSLEDDVRNMIESTANKFGRLDYMFNNAGINIFGEFKDMPHDHWKMIIDVNLMGVIHGTGYAYRVMLKQGFGHIVNMASLGGLVPAPFEVAYATTKFGVVGLSSSLRDEAKAYNIRVSAVCPSVIRTSLFESTIGLNIDVDKVMQAGFAKKAPSPEKPVQKILEGVAANKAIIPINADSKIIWSLYRHFPAIIGPINRLKLKRAREFQVVK